MKKIAFVLISAVLLLSCGDKKKDAGEESSKEVVVKDNYTVSFIAIYEKDDVLSMVIKKDGFWDYDHPIEFKVTGQPTIQRFSINAPEGVAVENVQVTLSTNKEQKHLTVKSIAIANNGREIFNGDNLAFVPYFNSNTGLTWDEKNLRYDLNFNGEYPPGYTGNEKLESMLVK